MLLKSGFEAVAPSLNFHYFFGAMFVDCLVGKDKQ